MAFKEIAYRLYSDYLMSSRLAEYEEIIKKSLDLGYQHVTLSEYHEKLKRDELQGRYFLHRHDIDTDIATAKEMFRIEQKYGVRASYYFRLSTIDVELMREINDCGSEVGYHFEELAQTCKDEHIKTKAGAEEKVLEARNKFSINFQKLEAQLGFKIKSVASHGDFVNRKLKIQNTILLNDEYIRTTLGIELEAYDESFLSSVDLYVSDKPFPTFYFPENVLSAIGNYKTINFLTHPRHWRTNWSVNTVDNIKRFWEGICW